MPVDRMNEIRERQDQADREFIAHARSDIPWLLDQYEEQEKLVAALLKVALDVWTHVCTKKCDKCALLSDPLVQAALAQAAQKRKMI